MGSPPYTRCLGFKTIQAIQRDHFLVGLGQKRQGNGEIKAVQNIWDQLQGYYDSTRSQEV